VILGEHEYTVEISTSENPKQSLLIAAFLKNT